MKIKAQSPLLNGWEGDATITTQHPASSYGIPVLVVENGVVGPMEASLAGLKVLEATDEERRMLAGSCYKFMAK